MQRQYIMTLGLIMSMGAFMITLIHHNEIAL